MMNRLTEEIKLRRKAKAVKRDQRRKELFEAFYQVSMGKIKESALPEDLDGSNYWNLVDT